MDPIIQKFKNKFVEEAQGLLDHLERDLLELEKVPTSKELIESAFRAMHTLKGVSGMYGFDFIGELTHQMESIWQSIRDNKTAYSRNIFEITFQSLDHMRNLLIDEQLESKQNQATHQMLMSGVLNLLNNQDVTTKPVEVQLKPGTKTWHILLRTTEMMFFRGISLINIFRELSALGTFKISKAESDNNKEYDVWNIFLTSEASRDEIDNVFIFIDDDCTIVQLENRDIFSFEKNTDNEASTNDVSIIDYVEDPAKHKKEEAKIDDKRNTNNTVGFDQQSISKRISVDSSKLDHLMFLVSELITVNSQLLLSTHGPEFNKIKPYLEKIDTLSKQFRNNAIDIRLVPLSDTVLRFQRLIRDLSHQLGKKIEFKTQGTETELDKNTIDLLSEPLMHIIRNSIDHGIESPEKRAQAGKSEIGTIMLTAYNSGNSVFICITDDGGGIDKEKVRQKAIDKGLIKSGEKISDKELFDFIFIPGFSTAQSLTAVSGRGVGMDVVKKRITDLRGEVSVDSGPGEGTSFTLKLQQSLSIIDSLLFTVEDNYFTVPIAEIEICSQINHTEINKRRHTGTIPLHNYLIPFIDLRETFNIDGSYPTMIKMVVIKSNDKEIALLTDKIVGEHQAVLKPLGKSLNNQQNITSASQLGNGKMAFMLDTNYLFKTTV
jgi:two-component system chemotaxis sensor kinase CheA